MANFCRRCGTPCHQPSGLCPKCDAQALMTYQSTPNFCAKCGGTMDKHSGKCPHCEPSPVAVTPTPSTPKAAPKGRTSVGTRILSVCVAIIFAVVFLFTTLLFAVRGVISPKNADVLVDAIDWAEVVELVPYEDRGDFYRYFYRILEAELDDGLMEEFLQEPATRRFLIRKMEAVLEGIVEQRDVVISSDDIADLLMDNSGFFYERLHVSLPTQWAELLASFIASNQGEVVLEVGDLLEDIPVVYDLILLADSDVLMIILTVVLLLLAALLLWNHLPSGVWGLGAVGLLVGVVSLIAVWIVPQCFNGTIGDIVAAVIGGYWLPALLVLVAGLILLCLGVVLEISAYKRSRR